MPDDKETPVVDEAPVAENTNSAGGGISPAETLERLRADNLALTEQIEQLVQGQADREDLARRLTQAERQNARLCTRYTQLALAHAVDEAALGLGIAPKAAEMYRSRFSCEIDDRGLPRIQPDPAELLARELRDNPLLRESIRRGREDRNLAAVTAGAAEVSEADPVELTAALDRNPGRKAQFIRRHGAQAFVDLAEAARRKGYRQ